MVRLFSAAVVVFLVAQPHRTGYELQIWDHQPGGYLTGSLVNSVIAPPAPRIIPQPGILLLLRRKAITFWSSSTGKRF